MSLSILIVEDEAIIADDISLILEQNGYVVEGIADTFEEALHFLSRSNPDLVLLDIMIRGDKTGLDFGELLNREYQTPFIYLTSLFDQKTVAKANETNPVGYIVKPYKEADLLVGLQMGWKKHKLRQTDPKTSSKPIFVRHDGALIPLDPKDICYAEASDNYTYLFTRQDKYVVSVTMKSIEQQLNQSEFCRIHKSFIINLSKIEMIEHSVVFIQGRPLPIGKVYKKSLLDSLTIF